MTSRALLSFVLLALVGCSAEQVPEKSAEEVPVPGEASTSSPAEEAPPAAPIALVGRTCDALVTVRSALERTHAGAARVVEGTLGANVRFLSENKIHVETHAPLLPGSNLHRLATITPLAADPPSRLTWVIELADGAETRLGSEDKGLAKASAVLGRDDLSLTFAGAMPVDATTEAASLHVEAGAKVSLATCR
jgi:hypothetical protein